MDNYELKYTYLKCKQPGYAIISTTHIGQYKVTNSLIEAFTSTWRHTMQQLASFIQLLGITKLQDINSKLA